MSCGIASSTILPFRVTPRGTPATTAAAAHRSFTTTPCLLPRAELSPLTQWTSKVDLRWYGATRLAITVISSPLISNGKTRGLTHNKRLQADGDTAGLRPREARAIGIKAQIPPPGMPVSIKSVVGKVI